MALFRCGGGSFNIGESITIESGYTVETGGVYMLNAITYSTSAHNIIITAGTRLARLSVYKTIGTYKVRCISDLYRFSAGDVITITTTETVTIDAKIIRIM